MISIYALCVLLCVSFCVQAQAQGPPFTIKSVSRVDKGEMWKVIVELEGAVTGDWYYHENLTKRVIKEFETKNEPGKPQKTQLKIKKGTSPYIVVRLKGHRGLQKLVMSINLEGSGSRSEQLDLPVSEVIPGPDVVYVPNEPTNVTIKVQESRGNGLLEWEQHRWYLFASYLEGNTVTFRESADFLKDSFDSHDGVTTTSLTFREKEDATINGYFYSELDSVASKTNPLIRWVTEHLTILAHEKSNKGPFPNDFITASISSKNGEATCKTSSSTPFCRLSCGSYSNDFQSIDLKKVGTEAAQGLITMYGEFDDFLAIARLILDAKPTGTREDYICTAVSKNGNRATTNVTLVYEASD